MCVIYSSLPMSGMLEYILHFSQFTVPPGQQWTMNEYAYSIFYKILYA